MKTCPLCENTYPSQHSTCPTDGALLIDLRELEPGTVIRGKYRIVRQLGRGGMGTVYLAEHILLNRPRALKFISSELSQDAVFLRRFRREAQAAIELRHTNIVEVVDLDQAEDGSPYIAMEYVEGPDLRHTLAGGAFPVERALHIARGIALGLGAAHAKGIIHRDVKPENILLVGGHGAPETPKLLDFGIAAMKESVTVASRTHGLLLTPPYAAPEQWKGMAAEELDGRVDLYALGGVLYEMLTGSTAFHAHNTEGWMYQHLHQQPPSPSQLRPELANWPGLDALVLRLLAKDREKRPRDVDELVKQIDSVLRGVNATHPATVVEALPISFPKLVRALPRSKTTIWVIAVALIVLGLGIWAVARFTKSPSPISGEGAQTATQKATISTPTAAKPSTSTTVAPATIPGGDAQAETLTWTDPATGLIWAKKDNGSNVTWQQATDYCRNLQLAAHSGWRLPNIDELAGIYDRNINVHDYHVKGNLQLSGWHWSSSPGNASGEAYYFFFSDGERGSDRFNKNYDKRALCVYGSANKGSISAVNPAPVTPAPTPGGGTQADALTWTDPATGLMWTKKENSSNPNFTKEGGDVDWQQATDYCRNLRLAGHSDWRLPAIDELQGIYDPNGSANANTWHVKGSLQTAFGLFWSSSPGNTSEQAWTFGFSTGERASYRRDYGFAKRALCVRRSGGGGDNRAAKSAPIPAPKNPKKITVSPGVMAGMIVQKTQPVYPTIARVARVSGTVVLQATISKTGSVKNIHVVSGHPLLQQAAVDAVKTWRYQPYLLNGEPVEVETTVNVVFTLGE